MHKHIAGTALCAIAGVGLGLIAPHVYQPWADGRDPIRVSATIPARPTPAGGQHASHSVTAALVAALPFYGQEAPGDCYEDMVCWIGSAHDGRDDAAIAADLYADITAAQAAYPDEGTGWEPVTQTMGDVLAEGSETDVDWEACLMHVNEATNTVVVACPDGTVVTA